ncbi:MAG: hypothetical protein J3K34DRAFT_251016 [Monoraphidium minutum]|nr:MAG: hypothetical protein J3K34DRAFT_251016 [Monoraphidium minutum]
MLRCLWKKHCSSPAVHRYYTRASAAPLHDGGAASRRVRGGGPLCPTPRLIWRRPGGVAVRPLPLGAAPAARHTDDRPPFGWGKFTSKSGPGCWPRASPPCGCPTWPRFNAAACRRACRPCPCPSRRPPTHSCPWLLPPCTLPTASHHPRPQLRRSHHAQFAPSGGLLPGCTSAEAAWSFVFIGGGGGARRGRAPMAHTGRADARRGQSSGAPAGGWGGAGGAAHAAVLHAVLCRPAVPRGRRSTSAAAIPTRAARPRAAAAAQTQPSCSKESPPATEAHSLECPPFQVPRSFDTRDSVRLACGHPVVSAGCCGAWGDWGC